MDTLEKIALLERAVSSLSAVVLGLVEKFGKDAIDVPSVEKLKENSAKLAAMPDLHKPESGA